MSVSIFGGTGRPKTHEAERRGQEFIRLLAAGLSFKDARKGAKITGDRALEILWDQRELCHLDEDVAHAA